jgi:hypothetical protein
VDCALSLLKAGCSHPSEDAYVNKAMADQASFLHELMGSGIVSFFNRLASFMYQSGERVGPVERLLPTHLQLLSDLCDY